MTPAEYEPLVRAWRNKQRRIQSRFAMVAHMVVAAQGNKGFKREDFMDGWDAEDVE